MKILLEKIAISLGVIVVFGAVLGGVVISINDLSSNQAQAQQVNTAERTVTETKKVSVGFETKTVYDDTLEYGRTVIRSEGATGEKTYTYSVVYKGDKEVSRKLIKEEVTKQPVTRIIAKGTKIKIIWHCIDVTSYDKNPYNDNKCTSSTGEIRYVSDSQARALDPTYSPGQSGNWWYNSK